MKASETITLRDGTTIKLPSNYVEKPNTLIMVDNNKNLIFHDNGDGTVSGLDVKLFSI